MIHVPREQRELPRACLGRGALPTHLNRYRLLVARAKKIERMIELLQTRALAEASANEAVVDAIQQMINEQLSPASPFCGLARAVIEDPEASGAR